LRTGYINNPDDETYLNSEKKDRMNEIVESIVRGYKKAIRNEVEQVVQK